MKLEVLCTRKGIMKSPKRSILFPLGTEEMKDKPITGDSSSNKNGDIPPKQKGWSSVPYCSG